MALSRKQIVAPRKRNGVHDNRSYHHYDGGNCILYTYYIAQQRLAPGRVPCLTRVSGAKLLNTAFDIRVEPNATPHLGIGALFSSISLRALHHYHTAVEIVK